LPAEERAEIPRKEVPRRRALCGDALGPVRRIGDPGNTGRRRGGDAQDGREEGPGRRSTRGPKFA
jgi:hypothetical protein